MEIIDLKVSGDLHIKNLCRLCLTVAEKDNAIPIFQQGYHTQSLVVRIQECTSLEISEDDGLPPNVCNACVMKVTEWYEFKQNAKRSDDSLRQLLSQPFRNPDDENSCSGASVADLVIKREEESYSDDTEDDIPLSEISCSKKYIQFSKKDRKTRKTSEDDSKRRTRGRAPKVKPFCATCNLKFIRFPEYFEHQRDVHGFKSGNEELPKGVDSKEYVIYRCHICKEEFQDRSDLRSHCRLTHDVKVIHPYGCSHCERQFPSWSLLVVHERQHTGEKPYSCDLCGKENFISLASLRRHKLMHLKMYSCPQCGRDFNCDSALKAHIRCKHTDEKPFLCNICGRSFSLATILNAHMTSHSSERKYRCDICGFRSKTSGNHHRHRARHNQGGAKTFHCETCGKAFETKLKLSSHQIIHRSVRPHVCKVCGKGFLYKNKLERHILLVHARQRPYPCHLCGRKLASKFGLGIHLKTHNKPEGMGEGALEVVQDSSHPQILEPVHPQISHPQHVQEITLLIN